MVRSSIVHAARALGQRGRLPCREPGSRCQCLRGVAARDPLAACSSWRSDPHAPPPLLSGLALLRARSCGSLSCLRGVVGWTLDLRQQGQAGNLDRDVLAVSGEATPSLSPRCVCETGLRFTPSGAG